MSRLITNRDFCTEWKHIKVEFENCAKKIKNYEHRPLDNEQRKEIYANEIVLEFNKIILWISNCIEEFTGESQRELLNKIDRAECILLERLKILSYQIDLPSDRLDVIDVSSLRKILIDDSVDKASDEEVNESLEFDNNIESVENISSESVNVNVEKEENLSKIKNRGQLVIQKGETMAPPSTEAFLTTCGRQITKHFAGDPLELTSFLRSIRLLKTIAESDVNKRTLANFIITRLSGKAIECVDEECEDVDEIVEDLKKAIRPENSKVVAGRLMALRADKANLTDFAKRAEQLSESFQRSLVLEGTSRVKAIELTIDKTIDLCKANTTSSVVKSVLAASKFQDANEVIAKYTIETRNVVADSQTFHFRSNFRNRGNFIRNFRGNFQQNHNRGGFYNNNRQQFRGNNRQGGWNYGNRGRGFGNFRGNSRGNFRGSNDRGNSVFYNSSENDQAPPPGAQSIRMNRADD